MEQRNAAMHKEKKEKWIQNLRDAGCREAVIAEFLEDWESGRKKQALRLLDGHRKQLLAEFHTSRERIDCLDYLLFQMEREEKADALQKKADALQEEKRNALQEGH